MINLDDVQEGLMELERAARLLPCNIAWVFERARLLG